MRRVLLVYGDTNAARTFEQSHTTLQEAYELAAMSELGEHESEINGINVIYEAFQFDEIDTEFIIFMGQHFIDENKTNTKNFYIV